MIRIVYVERTARTGKHPHHFGRVNLGNRTLQRTKYPGNLVVRTSLQRIVNAAYHLLRNDVLLQRVEQGCAIAANHCQHMGNVAYLRVFLPEIPDTGGQHIGCGSAPKVRVLYALLCQVGNDRNGVLTCVARIRHIFGLYGVHKVRPVRITEIKTKVS